MTLRNNALNYVEENQCMFSFYEPSNDDDNVATTTNSEEVSDNISHAQTKRKLRKSDIRNNQHSNKIEELKEMGLVQCSPVNEEGYRRVKIKTR